MTEAIFIISSISEVCCRSPPSFNLNLKIEWRKCNENKERWIKFIFDFR